MRRAKAKCMSEAAEHARLMLRKALEDLDVLEVLAEARKPVQAAIGFHAQQAVEKSLKAVLANRGLTYPRTHDLKVLLKFLGRHGIALPPDAGELAVLTPYAGEFRYDVLPPEGTGEAPLDTTRALEMARRTRAWAEHLLAEQENPQRDA